MVTIGLLEWFDISDAFPLQAIKQRVSKLTTTAYLLVFSGCILILSFYVSSANLLFSFEKPIKNIFVLLYGV